MKTKERCLMELRETIEIYFLALQDLEKRKEYESIQYKTMWHYCDGLDLAHFIFTGERFTNKLKGI